MCQSGLIAYWSESFYKERMSISSMATASNSFLFFVDVVKSKSHIYCPSVLFSFLARALNSAVWFFKLFWKYSNLNSLFKRNLFECYFTTQYCISMKQGNLISLLKLFLCLKELYVKLSCVTWWLTWNLESLKSIIIPKL